MGSKTPIVTLAGFGGSAQQVWECVRGDRNSFIRDEELDLMANPDWVGTSAARFVECLFNQIQRQEERAKQDALGESERHRRRVLTTLALVGSVVFVVVLLALTQLPVISKLSFWFRCLLFAVPAVAGASGPVISALG
jgi:hypothetical protein